MPAGLRKVRALVVHRHCEVKDEPKQSKSPEESSYTNSCVEMTASKSKVKIWLAQNQWMRRKNPWMFRKWYHVVPSVPKKDLMWHIVFLLFLGYQFSKRTTSLNITTKIIITEIHHDKQPKPEDAATELAPAPLYDDGIRSNNPSCTYKMQVVEMYPPTTDE